MTTATLTLTRPSNTTPYTAGDVLGAADAGTPANAGSAVWSFAALRNDDGDIIVHSAAIKLSNTSIPSGMTTLVLHLYDGAPEAILDNAAFTLSSTGDKSKYLGSITFTPAVVGGMLFNAVTPNLQLALARGQSSLWGQLVTTVGYTPVSGSTITVTLNARKA